MEAERREDVDVIDYDLNEDLTELFENNEYVRNLYMQIEERIERLEGLIMSARQRQEWRLARPAANDEALNAVPAPEVVDTDTVMRQERMDGLKKRDSSLVALALEMSGEAQPRRKNSGEAFFDCNICSGKAREPILTCCGHLFCWPCFYQLAYVTPDTKECPACNGEVKDTGITPIYGTSHKDENPKPEKSGLKIPPRPQARRIERWRKQRITRGLTHSASVEEAPAIMTSDMSSILSFAERMVEDLERNADPNPLSGRGVNALTDAGANSDI